MRINTLLALVLSVSTFSVNVLAHEGEDHQQKHDMKHSCMKHDHDKKDGNGSEMKHEGCEQMDHSKMNHEEHQQQDQTPKDDTQHEQHQH